MFECTCFIDSITDFGCGGNQYFHGILLGLLGDERMDSRVNAESSEGYNDISAEVEDRGFGIKAGWERNSILLNSLVSNNGDSE